MNSTQQKIQHLWWRAGFGPPSDQMEAASKQKPEQVFHAILKASEKRPVFFDVASPELKTLVSQQMDLGKNQRLGPEVKQIFRKQSVQDIARLNLRWLEEMTGSPAQLREKMSLFWHGHFATKTVHILYDQFLLNIIREHALGNFRNLLFNVCKSASMIQFLNNNQNKKGHPNENFARELMELFMIGRGNYTESDIKESARAFTGWGADLQGDFEFRSWQHDDGVKSFMGKTGNFSGEDILDILLEQKQTALFITNKIYRFFVNEAIDKERLIILSTRFFNSGYDIQDLITGIFTAEWFYDEKNIGNQIKSPVVWLVGIRRQLPMEIQNPGIQLMLEHLLGQVLFSPPSVAGWHGGKHWIDSSSLMLRMQVPRILFLSDSFISAPREDDDLMMGMLDKVLRKQINRIQNPGAQLFQTKIFWDAYIKNFDKVRDDELYTVIRDRLVQRDLPINENEIIKYIDNRNRESRITSLTIRIMGTPEYQLC